MQSNRVRRDAKEFWSMVQEIKHAPVRKRPPEGESCKTCKFFNGIRCAAKKKLVNHYNVCERHQK